MTHLLEVSYCLVVSSLFLYQLEVDVIQPVLLILFIRTSLFKLHVCEVCVCGRDAVDLNVMQSTICCYAVITMY